MSNIEVLPVENWFRDNAQGGLDICDPVEGAPINPDAAPMFLLDQDELWDGQQVYDHGKLRNVTIGMWAAAGGAKAEDLDGPMQDFPDVDFEQAVREAQVTGYVYTGLNADLEDARIELARETAQRGGSPASIGNTYIDRVTRAVAVADGPAFYTGVDSVAVSGSDPVSGAIAEMRDRVTAMYKADRPEADAAAIVVQNTEQWAAALRWGALLGGVAMDAQSQGGSLESGLIVAPASYFDMIRKIKVLGVDQAGLINVQPAIESAAVQYDAYLMRTGYIPAEDLR
jgi:hypothetical protein